MISHNKISSIIFILSIALFACCPMDACAQAGNKPIMQGDSGKDQKGEGKDHKGTGKPQRGRRPVDVSNVHVENGEMLTDHSEIYKLMIEASKHDTIITYSTDTIVRVIATPEEPPVPRGEVIRRLLNNMLFVEGGSFVMGATGDLASKATNWELPAHKVRVGSFYIGRYEVTQREWTAIMGNNPSIKKCGDCPVREVSWNDCQQFIEGLNELTGLTFRLPTEAEWEYAARGGNLSTGYLYAGSNNIDDVAWYYDNSDSTHPVGEKQSNELGIYDMSGNVWEWCLDYYTKYTSEPQTNPTGPTEGTHHAVRGGGWDYDPQDCRVSNRAGMQPTEQMNNLGLRLVLPIAD